MKPGKNLSCTPQLFAPILCAVISLFPNNGYSQQQNASVNVEFELAQPKIILNFTIDGTDSAWGLSTNEICDLGTLDSNGTAISGAPVGNPNVNGVAGIPVNSSGAPLADFYDSTCVGAFYPLFTATGGNATNTHPSCAICIYVRFFLTGGWTLSTSAQLLSSTTNVTLDQLKWKMDATASSGFQSYTNFTTSGVLVDSGPASFFSTRYIYIDYGLLVEYADAPGANSWLVTYTLVET
ncbi:MAG: hypothetical protein QG657_1750 [Acidobacteriota bacterium]|nr:hypothetical protein [Acidobacteriota bacterium]